MLPGQVKFSVDDMDSIRVAMAREQSMAAARSFKVSGMCLTTLAALRPGIMTRLSF